MAPWLTYPHANDPFASFERLRREMDPLFGRSGDRSARRAGAFPPVNLYETVDGYVLTAELPGLAAEEIDIQIEGNRVTVGGERRIEHPEDASLHRTERAAGSFRRSVELPAEVDPEKAEASHRDGVLRLRIPKSERHQPRKIAVQNRQQEDPS
jgi:HSP20 family protein